MLEDVFGQIQGREEGMRKSNLAERRQHPRISSELPIKVAANGYDFATTTRNLSCIGAYCHINKYIPPFTRVLVRVTLPLKNKKSNKDCEVECKGVLVRTEDEGKGFNVAIFFNQISKEQKRKIAAYVNQFICQDSSSS